MIQTITTFVLHIFHATDNSTLRGLIMIFLKISNPKRYKAWMNNFHINPDYFFHK